MARASFCRLANRVEHDGRSDVREHEKELQEGPQVDLVVLAPTGDVPGRVVENWLEESERSDGGDERDDEEHSEDPGVPLVILHPPPPFEPSSAASLGHVRLRYNSAPAL
jgi:hypothetical protein